MDSERRPTISDISGLTGLSRSTVSRVISGNGYVSSDKRELILDVLKNVNYTPQKKHKTKGVGDLVMIVSGLLMSPVQIIIIESIIASLDKAGLKAMVSYNQFDPHRMEEYLAYAGDRYFAGIILLGILESPGVLRQLKKMDLPVVSLNQEIPGVRGDLIMLDDYKGGYMAAECLIKRGHRRIGVLMGYAEARAAQDRERGIRDALKDSDIDLKTSDVHYGDFTQKCGLDFAEMVLKKRSSITGIISCNDLMSAGFIYGLTQASVRIPQDYSIIGFDRTFVTESARLKLVSIHYDFQKVGEAAAEMIVRREGNPFGDPEKILFSPRLIDGNSVSSPRN